MDYLVRTPILGHVHVPKTAGSSFRKVLDGHFRDTHLHLYFDHSTTFVYENSELAELIRPPRVRAFSSHFVRRFPAAIAGRRVHYCTFLRHPVEQFISYITYTRKHYAAIQEPVLLSHLPPQMPRLGIRECARWILNQQGREFRNFGENYVTNFFGRYPLLDKGLEYSHPLYQRKRLRMARSVLSGFLTVGISERMDESWRVLRNRAARVGIELPDSRIPVENVSGDGREAMDWIHADDEVGSKLLLSIAEDLKLYRWASARLTRLEQEQSGQRSVFTSWFGKIFSARPQLLR